MTLSFAEIDSQHVELLPARTVMSLFTLGGGKHGHGGHGEGGSVSCLISIGNLSVGLGAILGTGSADGHGSSCNSVGKGGG
ncbi:MAG: hypothetical protein M3143_13910 [Actinomycetota bacterium]|nr:hypothetical protein [Actinomycetota bacterium]